MAKATAVPAYVVFTDATLTAIAESRPEALPAVAAVSGVGARKLELYGQAVLDVVSGADPQEVAARSVRAD
ncbi:MAG: HRDC domain-containing protein [Dermatophilaceae bacterium]